MSLATIFYIVSMAIIAVSVLFFINDFRVRSQNIIDLTNQKNSLDALQAKQAIIRTQVLRRLFFKEEHLNAEILSATEDYDFILNNFITVANNHENITDISLYNEVTASFSQLRELSFQLIRDIQQNKTNAAINLFKNEYTQRENIISVFITNAQYGKEEKIRSLNKESKKFKLLFTYTFLVEILITLIVTYLIHRRVNNDLLRKNIKLKKLACRDVLTGLYNRRLFIEQLASSIEFAKRNDLKFILFFIDLDGFKLINDTKGHLIGDQVLIEVSERIYDSVRGTDTVYRLGGDEFTVILECMDDTSGYKAVAKKLITVISKPYYIEDQKLLLSASIGVSVYPEHGISVDTIVSAADAAMYSVKSEGKNNYLCFSKKILADITHRTNLKSDLRNAITNDELFLLYQPKIDLATNTIVGCEALVRWRHPTKGIISPVEFIPLAEDSGFIVDIGLWVIQEVSSQIVDWRKRNIGIPQVAINLSGMQLAPSESRNQLFDILKNNPFPPSMLAFELTESVIMEYQSTESFDSLLRLKECGYSISVDDFGTGYSSLSYLKHLPIDTLKIDRSFIVDLIESEDGQAIVKAIIALAKSLELKTIAEGVDTKRQLEFLKDCGCDQVQGYYFAKPLSVEDMETFNDKQSNSTLVALN